MDGMDSQPTENTGNEEVRGMLDAPTLVPL